MASKSKARKKGPEKARAKHRVKGRIIKEFPPALRNLTGLNPDTEKMTKDILGLRQGQLIEFDLPSSREAKLRRDSLRKLRKKRLLEFKRLERLDSKLYVEK